MLLVAFEQRLCSGDILGQLVRLDDSLRVVGPRDQIAIIRQKSLQAVGILEDLLAVGGLFGKRGKGKKWSFSAFVLK